MSNEIPKRTRKLSKPPEPQPAPDPYQPEEEQLAIHSVVQVLRGKATGVIGIVGKFSGPDLGLYYFHGQAIHRINASRADVELIGKAKLASRSAYQEPPEPPPMGFDGESSFER